MLRVIRNHRRAAHGESPRQRVREPEDSPVPIDRRPHRARPIDFSNASSVLARASKAWDDAP
jgi:hypothetical protein